MNAVSESLDAGTSNSLHQGLQAVASALAATPLEKLAKAVGKDDTQVCKIRAGDVGAKVSEVVKLLHAAGLRVVPADSVCVKREKYEAMLTIAVAAMADPETARRITLGE